MNVGLWILLVNASDSGTDEGREDEKGLEEAGARGLSQCAILP